MKFTMGVYTDEYEIEISGNDFDKVKELVGKKLEKNERESLEDLSIDDFLEGIAHLDNGLIVELIQK